LDIGKGIFEWVVTACRWIVLILVVLLTLPHPPEPLAKQRGHVDRRPAERQLPLLILAFGLGVADGVGVRFSPGDSVQVVSQADHPPDALLPALALAVVEPERRALGHLTGVLARCTGRRLQNRTLVPQPRDTDIGSDQPSVDLDEAAPDQTADLAHSVVPLL